MNILAVIPARYDSQRFPGKPLVRIGERPMVQWVYEAALRCSAFTDVVVATDSEAVAETVRSFGGRVEMTASTHQTGTDRVAELAVRRPDAEVVVNVQGDQPFVTTEMLLALIRPYLEGLRPEMTTLACPLGENAHQDPNAVKVILDQNGKALYFSRAPIPYYREAGTAPVHHHLGLYAFRGDFLQTYSQLSPTPLERIEGLEQLRVLEHGHTIIVGHTSTMVPEINTPDDLALAEELLRRGGL